MPRTKLDAALPDPGAMAKLIERYIKIENRITIDEATSRAGASTKRYYSRMKDPGDFTLKEMRMFGKALKIPRDELCDTFWKAVKY